MKGLKSRSDHNALQILLLAGAVLLGTLGAAVLAERFLVRNVPVPRLGALDLRPWSFEDQGSVTLGGTWRFLPERLVSAADMATKGTVGYRHVPDTRFSPRSEGYFQGTGSGTYTLRVHLPSRNQTLSLKTSTVWTAFEIEANGFLVAQVGLPGEGSWAQPGFGSRIVSLGTVRDTLDLTVRVSNHEYRWGGIVEPFVLGTSASLEQQHQRDGLVSFLLIGALAGIAISSLCLYVLRRKEPVSLFLAGFALTVALKALTSEDNLITWFFPSLSFDTFVRLGYAAQYLLVPMAAMFFYRLFREEFTNTTLVWFLAPSAVFLLMLFAPISWLSWSIIPYAVVSLVQVAYGYFAVCLRPAVRHRPGGVIVLVAGTILLGGILLSVRSEVFLARAESLFPGGLVAFVFVQSLAMAKRLTWAFDHNETLTAELKSVNRRLMDEARAAEDAREEVELSLAEKEILLREVHHRVKNSLQIVLSIVNMRVRRATSPEVVEAYGVIRDQIRAISSLHERLFGLDSERRVDLLDYLQDLLGHLKSGHGDTPSQLVLDGHQVFVPLDLCVEIGLILTELVTNAFQHSRAPGGLVQVTLHEESTELVLTVADQGQGFPEGFVPDTDTVGFRIIGGIVRQRKGSVTVTNSVGAVVQVRFPTPFTKD